MEKEKRETWHFEDLRARTCTPCSQLIRGEDKSSALIYDRACNAAIPPTISPPLNSQQLLIFIPLKRCWTSLRCKDSLTLPASNMKRLSKLFCFPNKTLLLLCASEVQQQNLRILILTSSSFYYFTLFYTSPPPLFQPNLFYHFSPIFF